MAFQWMVPESLTQKAPPWLGSLIAAPKPASGRKWVEKGTHITQQGPLDSLRGHRQSDHMLDAEREGGWLWLPRDKRVSPGPCFRGLLVPRLCSIRRKRRPISIPKTQPTNLIGSSPPTSKPPSVCG